VRPVKRTVEPDAIAPLSLRELKRTSGTGDSWVPDAGPHPNTEGTFCSCGCPDINYCGT